MIKFVAFIALAGFLAAGCASREANRGGSYNMLATQAPTGDADSTLEASPETPPDVGGDPDADSDDTPGGMAPSDSSHGDMAPPDDNSSDSDPSIFLPRNKNRAILI